MGPRRRRNQENKKDELLHRLLGELALFAPIEPDRASKVQWFRPASQAGFDRLPALGDDVERRAAGGALRTSPRAVFPDFIVR